LNGQAPCPCGGAEFGSCCGSVLGGADARDPEALMRSRYTAFALGDVRHLRDTWWPRTRPDDVGVDTDTEWLGLTVEASSAAGDEGRVSFRARWRDRRTGESGTLSEHSRFQRHSGRWYYVEAV